MKKLLLAMALALVLVLALGAPMLADEGYWECWEEEGYLDVWDEEGYWDEIPEIGHQEPDPCVAANEDFYWAKGWDLPPYPGGGIPGDEEWFGEQHWLYPTDNKNVYRDDVTDIGHLGAVLVYSFTSEKIDLPNKPSNACWDYGSPDTYYFATEPGTIYVMDEEAYQEWIVTLEAGEEWIVTREAGCEWVPATTGGGGASEDAGLPPPERVLIQLPDASSYFDYTGKCAGPIDFNDGTLRVQVPKGTYLTDSNGKRVPRLVVNEGGVIVTDVNFTYHGIAAKDGTEVTVTRL